MPPPAKDQAKKVAKKLLKSAHQREVELATSLPEFQAEMLVDSDAEEGRDLEAPLLESVCLLEGQTGLITLTNFDLAKFEELRHMIKDHVTTKWNNGRGRKTSHKGKDVFMMSLSVLRWGKPWDVVAQSYNMAAPVLKKLVTGFIDVIEAHLFNALVKSVALDWPMDRLKAGRKTFKSFPSVFYAVDVRFQQTNCPSGNHIESKPFFSGKHNLYSVKTKVVVNSVGLAVHCSKFCKGSVADKTILMDHLQTHLTLCRKTENGRLIEDNGPQRDLYPNHWSMIVDKEYQGIQESCCVVLPKKTKKWNSDASREA